MPKSNKEKQKSYYDRIREDPEKRTAYLKKRKESYQKKKDDGKIKYVDSLSRRDKRAQQAIWAERKRKSRENKKMQEKLLTNESITTPRSGTSTPQSQASFGSVCDNNLSSSAYS